MVARDDENQENMNLPSARGDIGGGSWSVRPMERGGEMDSSPADG